jgi:hypothetical protein
VVKNRRFEVHHYSNYNDFQTQYVPEYYRIIPPEEPEHVKKLICSFNGDG